MMKITYGRELVIDLQGCDASTFTEKNIRRYLEELCNLIEMKRYGKPVFWHDNSNTPHLKGVSAIQFISTSNIVIHTLDFLETAFINIFSCKDFDTKLAVDFSKRFFAAKKADYTIVERKTKAFDNPKIELKNHKAFGKGIFAQREKLETM